MSRVIVFGASGLLGSSLVPILKDLGYEVFTQGRFGTVDLCLDSLDSKSIAVILIKYRPMFVINLIAATNVDLCEVQPDIAWQGNVEAVSAIVDGIVVCGDKSGIRPHLVHISTDQVYDGSGHHTEEKIHPINVYGLTKYTGELLASSIGATILRTNFFGRSRCLGRQSFSDWLVNNFLEKNPITLFDDVRFSALHLNTLCKIIAQCMLHRPIGAFNAGCRDAITKADFALKLAKELGISVENVRVGLSTDFVFKARRPLNMSLQVSRLERALNIELPTILNEIEQTAEEYLNDDL